MRFLNCKTLTLLALCCINFAPIVKGDLTCPDGWTLYFGEETCVKYFDQTKSWDEGRKACQSLGADLVMIKDANKYSFIKDFNKYNSIFLGLKRDSTGSFKWLDGTTPSYTHWGYGEPNNQNNNEKCAVMDGWSQNWNDVSCDNPKPYYCEQTALHTAPGTCPSGSTQYNGLCYELFTQKKLWADAEAFCKLKGGHLAIIKDAATQSFIEKTFNGQITIDTWIGYSDTASEGNYVDVTGEPMSYSNWDYTEPNDYNYNEDCVSIYSGHGNRWADQTCSNDFHFICQTPVTRVDIHCDDGWDLNVGYKTCLKVVRTKLTWEKARSSCQSLGGDLVKIADSAFNTYVQKRLGSNVDYWIGLHQQHSTNKLVWLDETIDPTYQDLSGTGLIAGKQNCGGIAKTGHWKDLDCTKQNYYVCERASFAKIECPAGYAKYEAGTTCIQIHTDTLKWEKARTSCQQEGGDLVTIPDSATNTFVLNLIASQKVKASYWIGLNDRQAEKKFQWLENTTVIPFSYWDKNEPDDVNNDQNCVQIDAIKNSHWVDDGCSVERNYICQQAATINGKKIPTTRVNLFCPDGWTKYGPKQTCLKLHQDTKIWSAARTTCQSGGGDLVKIKDSQYLKFINDLLTEKASSSYYPYIGLNDISKEGDFVWLDEKMTASFTHWRSGEPSAGTNEDCAEIWVKQEWNDIPCSLKRPYICEQPGLAAGSVSCGAGWEDSLSTDYCYRFNLEALTWQDARDSCQLQGGDLSSILNIEEMLYLEGRMQSLNDQTFWTGGNDIATERGWTWSDGSPFAFFNWNAGQPTNNASANCFSIHKDTGRWSVDSCEDRMPSLCKKLGNTINHPTAAPTTSPMYVPSDKVWGCPKAWQPYRGSCYLALNSKAGINWQGAKSTCQAQGSSLVAITDAEENKFVLSLLPKGFGNAWIGLNALKKAYSFSWSDGVTPVTYTNWNVGEPNHVLSNELCVQMLNNGVWDDNICTYKKSYTVCKQNKKIRDKSDFAQYDGCKQYGIGFQDKCYEFYANDRSFNDAEKYCTSIGGHLATVNDRFVQSFLSAELYGLSGGSYWIGLSFANSKSSSNPAGKTTYSWTSGTTLDYSNWDRSHTGNDKTQCVGILTAQPTGLWHNYLCTQVKPFICEYPRPGYTTPKPITTTPSLLPCPTGWIPFGQMCYWKSADDTDQKKNWMDAKAACARMAVGGNLASITSLALSDKLHKEIDSSSFYPSAVWIGLNDRDLEGGFMWADSQPFIYNKWASGEPNDDNNREDCVVWDATATQDNWNDRNCYSINPYLCQAPRGTQLITTLTPPTVGSMAKQCGSEDWRMYNGNCYLLSTYLSYRTWYDARDYCHSDGAELASIKDQDENNFITALMNNGGGNEYSRGFWIGLNDLDGDVYKWVDGSPAFYRSWGTSEPNDGAGGERCAEILVSGGSWNDFACHKELDFICKKKPGSSSPITVPTKAPPKGGCPDKFVGVPGTSHCYHIGGQSSPDRKSLSDAAKACKAINPKSRLASIHSAIDEDFLITKIATLKMPAWIGLKDSYYAYIWVDNTKRDYEHWGPSVNSFYSGCVEMDVNPKTAGDWSEVSCSQKLPYICEFRKDPLFKQDKPDTHGCSSGYQRFRNSCYKYVSAPQSWSKSEAACVSDGGHLVSIQDRFEEAQLELLTRSDKAQEFWTGLSDNSARNAFTWTDGWPVLYTHWNDKSNSTERCVVYTKGSGWNTEDCTQHLPFVCEINKDSAPAPTPSVPGKCPDNSWTQYGDDCYLVEANVFKSWPEAEYVCQGLGGSLASIHSAADAKAVSLFIGLDKLDAWIGLHRSGLGGFEWSDQTAFQYFNWAPGTLSLNSTGTMHQECVLAQGLDGLWTNTDCFLKHGYICKTKQVPLTTPTTTTTTTTEETTVAKATTTKKTTTLNPATTTSKYNGIVTQGHHSKQKGQASSSGLSSGTIGGIVIGVLCFLAIVIVVTLLHRRRVSSPQPSAGFDNAAYNVSKEGSSDIHFGTQSSA